MRLMMKGIFLFISAWLFAFLGMTQTTFAKLQTNDDSLCKQPEYIEKILRQHKYNHSE
ncbi:hypothetical protein [Acinetobacter towneri]|uniref:Uncharacterized protein n=1 Tax=Acinetobacter towneri TaxID=202956 RepID=A0ABX7TC73_9GAMM|nr:hypothetical protein [Acinetobacter towneri]QTD60092.1 hypothetical protein J4G44_05600 [Acinetobacter towneri]QTD61339.1 hypothetical protein J4G45_11115 [Acinetobacter towneri]